MRGSLLDAANELAHLEDIVVGSMPVNGRTGAQMRVRSDLDAPGGAGSGIAASGAGDAKSRAHVPHCATASSNI